MTALHEEPLGTNIQLPDQGRVDKGIKKQKSLTTLMRLHGNATDRLYQDFKRLEDDQK